MYIGTNFKESMEKVISFVSVVKRTSDYSTSDIKISGDLERALIEGFKIKSFKQIVGLGSLSDSKNYVIFTFVLEK